MVAQISVGKLRESNQPKERLRMRSGMDFFGHLTWKRAPRWSRWYYIKREAAKASLRRPLSKQIKSQRSVQLFQGPPRWNHYTYFVSHTEIQEVYNKYLEKRFSKCKTIKGTKKFHSFTPKDEKLI